MAEVLAEYELNGIAGAKSHTVSAICSFLCGVLPVPRQLQGVASRMEMRGMWAGVESATESTSMMTDPQHLPDWKYQQNEAEEEEFQESLEWRDRRNPRDFPKVYDAIRAAGPPKQDPPAETVDRPMGFFRWLLRRVR